MRKSVLLITVLLLVASIPVMAARTNVVPLTHIPVEFLQAYPGTSLPTIEGGPDLAYAGYLGPGENAITAVPGVLELVPGINWANFVAAAQAIPAVPYSIKNVVLTKQTPSTIQCADVFPATLVQQQGTPNIRLNWPLMYEVPCTTFTLTILYGTPTAWADPANPGEPAYVHTEVWTFHVDATIDSVENLLALFNELPFGTDEVPLISDEVLYPVLQAKLEALEAALDMNDTVTAGLILGDFEMEVMDACIGISPLNPAPTGPGTGIANTLENPACCKLLADAEYIGFKYGIFQPTK